MTYTYTPQPKPNASITRVAGIFPVLFLFLMSACGPKPESAPVEEKPAVAVNADAALKPASPPANFEHKTALVNGVNIHYVIGGQGEPLVLVHGFGQNWYMWNRLLPELSKYFTVIAPDLRGVGESDKPDSGYDKKNMAVDVHELVKSLGYTSVNLAGHDIGLMVAYAYAAQFPTEVKKLALMDALLPGVEPVWSQVKGSAWWFGFFAMPVSGELVAGQERTFLTAFWPVVGHVNDAFTKDEVDEFVRAYAQSGGTTGSFHWFGAFSQDAIDNQQLMKTKLKMPVVTLGSEYFAAPFLETHTKLVAENVKGVAIKNSGHWIVQEQTEQTLTALKEFFLAK
ncbi:alpha/beta fold hydrolase [Chryseolinea lacunae]|uniref:Alpha/beta hydrolase n=1 Tax=Chryseolinea lacunae TaxID=2801331 RepID=A0ABS1KKI8_9BACT|nr:alpha/beta hydrolase [Chryseolinea lacunae]MBL0739865.1 alpha/beta hydrolase [Chryseolinea lacunae]